jgi:hypothetical protein
MERVYHAHIPLGVESFSVKGWNAPLSLLALAINPQFEGWQSRRDGERRLLLDAAGDPVQYYPSSVAFRVSATTNLKLQDPSPFALHTTLAPNQYLLSLRFQLKIFHGLEETAVQPQSLELIGVPADVAYDERIYRIRFALPNVPATDRIVLEVLAPEGQRICKFHLDLM